MGNTFYKFKIASEIHALPNSTYPSLLNLNLYMISLKNTLDFCGVEFSAEKVTPHDVCWIHEKHQEIILKESKELDLESVFSEKFSYLIPNGETFSNIDFGYSNKKTFLAERYGGRGVGRNGGGVRCGTIGGFQIKGIGKNPLAGQAEDTWHSYGGLHASDAIYEAIYGYILEKLLPVGLANIYGVIITGKNSAYIGCEETAKGKPLRTWGALLVREAVIRPAHFIRAPLYEQEPNSGISDDHTRVKHANQLLLRNFGNTTEYIKFLGRFLANCANQFAFSRMARITHGSITPSNLCIDGRWVDLTNTTFIGSGNNVAAGALPFYDEAFAVIPVLNEMTYTFSKYNKTELNTRPLVNYYFEQFEAYLAYHVCYIFSWDYLRIPDHLKYHALPVIAKIVNKIITRPGSTTDKWPNSLKEGDLIICLLKGLFFYEIEKSYGLNYLSISLRMPPKELSSLCESYISVIECLYPDCSKNWKTFCKRIVKVLKKSLLPEYFFKGRLENYLNDSVIESEDGLFRNLIESTIFAADWIFEDNTEAITIFADRSLRIVYIPDDGSISINMGGKFIAWTSFQEATQEIPQYTGRNLVYYGYNFWTPVSEIINFMADIYIMSEKNGNN